MLHVCEAWGELLSVEKVLPKAAQQPETALRHEANRGSCSLQTSQPFVLGHGLTIEILGILFALTDCRLFRLLLLFVAGLVF